MSQPPALTPDGQLARRQIFTPYYGLVQLALATIAYTDESILDELGVTKAIKDNVAKLPPLPAAANANTQPALAGTWAVEWGPCFDLSYSNLMYAATYREPAQGAAVGAPVFTAVVIRGTDTSDPGYGLIEQLIEDLDGEKTIPMQMPNTQAPALSIAKGTSDGLAVLLGLRPHKLFGQVGEGSILDHVHGMYQADNDVPVVVTGHSLGGCQTTVMATYLYYYLAGLLGKPVVNVVPNPFAAPTAGLADFAQNFDRIFPAATLWWNTLDVVSNAFQQKLPTPAEPLSLQYIANLWGGVTPAGPALPQTCLDLKKLSPAAMLQYVINHFPATYTQPTVGAQIMPGFVWTPPTPQCKNDWITQLEIQHFPPMYHRLMSDQTAVKLAPYPLQTVGKVDPCTAVPASGGRS